MKVIQEDIIQQDEQQVHSTTDVEDSPVEKLNIAPPTGIVI